MNPRNEVQPVRNNENVIRNNTPRVNVNANNEVQPRNVPARDITPRPRENSTPRIENRTNSSNSTPRNENRNKNKRN